MPELFPSPSSPSQTLSPSSQEYSSYKPVTSKLGLPSLCPFEGPCQETDVSCLFLQDWGGPASKVGWPCFAPPLSRQGVPQGAGYCSAGSREAEQGILVMEFSGPNILFDEPELLINCVMCSSELDDFSRSFSLLFSKILIQRQLSSCCYQVQTCWKKELSSIRDGVQRSQGHHKPCLLWK